MIYNNTLSEASNETATVFDQIEVLNERFSTPEAVQAEELAVQVYLDKGASAEFQHECGGKIVVTADLTPAGPMARVMIKEGNVLWRRVHVHLCMKDGTRLMQTFDI
ncbi:hypothetical protein GZ77_22815 [Endozoicomonas montiporae]|uniref:Uncharacterized protein n=2 Tax=Endozoicomonas montiporae TaxID=1027273 RepID=A0A081N0G7_9GAMM|nr:hypothetical protein [Endozoicomonas montiporae]AMO54400.1 hypothetical protein EZMO1_0128 [Endozoicomonas montiporae CL-33]KEQ11940.1 hypothetical protein GZ77_22815 [Endozoicomonas montiporae]